MDSEQLKKMDNNPSNPEKESSPKSGNDVAASDETPSQKPGAILAAGRVAAGLTEEQIASRLKMSVRQVRSLESDDYESLYGMATARGFVRAYARILKMDPEPLVASFSKRKKTPATVIASQNKPVETFVKSSEPFRKKRSASGKIVIFVIIVVAILVVASNMNFFSFLNKFKKESAEKTVTNVTPAPAVVPQASDTKQATPAADQVASENKPADSATANATGQTTQSNMPVSAQAAQNTSVAAAQTPPGKGSLLVIHFKAKSWLQVQKKDGSVIAEYVGKPGEKRQLEVTEPVTVIAGFAPGVNMEFRGAPVDLASSTTNSVAKVTLK